MFCPHCQSEGTTQLNRTTTLGYPVHRCRDCGKTFNKRTGTPLNFIEVPTDIVFQVVYFRFRFKLSYRDLAEMFLIRGFTFTHETVRDWAERFSSYFTDRLRQKRRNKIGHTWFVDETYVKIGGRWCYLYRGIDQYGNLVDVLLSEHRDMAAAKAFFQKAFELLKVIPERVITDGHNSYPGAVANVLGKEVKHRVSRCMDNPVEQSHRKIKQRYYPTLGFGEFEAAQRFCQTAESIFAAAAKNGRVRVSMQGQGAYSRPSCGVKGDDESGVMKKSERGSYLLKNYQI